MTVSFSPRLAPVLPHPNAVLPTRPSPKVGDTVWFKGERHEVLFIHTKDTVEQFGSGKLVSGMKGKLNIRYSGPGSRHSMTMRWPVTVDVKDLDLAPPRAPKASARLG